MSTTPTQLSLFHATEQSTFNFDLEATVSWVPGVDLEVGDMKFHFQCEMEQRETLEIVLDALAEAWRMPPSSLRQWKARPRLVELDPWYAEIPVFAYVRDTLDNGVIEIMEYEGNLTVCLPHPELWDANGLGWLNDYQACCSTNRQNRMPWKGNCCACTYGSQPHRTQ